MKILLSNGNGRLLIIEGIWITTKYTIHTSKKSPCISYKCNELKFRCINEAISTILIN